MSDQDRAFLTSLLLRKKPQKILEVGVAHGGSSILILNAIKNIDNAYLYSCDYNKMFYKNPEKETGYYVDMFPELKNKWTLYTGGLVCNHLDRIGGDIDFCLIDTVHSNPGEMLDILMVLPYLKNNATIVFHDTNAHARVSNNPSIRRQITNNLLMSALLGKKYIPADTPYKSFCMFNNIGAIDITSDSKSKVYEVFNLLTLDWSYIPNAKDIADFKKSLKRFYELFYLNYFEQVLSYQKLLFNEIHNNKPQNNVKSLLKKI